MRRFRSRRRRFGRGLRMGRRRVGRVRRFGSRGRSRRRGRRRLLVVGQRL